MSGETNDVVMGNTKEENKKKNKKKKQKTKEN
jgi:hypothetical protein